MKQQNMLLISSIFCSISIHTNGGKMNGEVADKNPRGSSSLYLSQSIQIINLLISYLA